MSFENPIRLIELFAGYGSQALAFEYLNIPFEHHFVCEFDKYAIQSYNEIHNTNFVTSDITNIHASDLNIIETNKYKYFMTYSFPCQDLSVAGNQKGMKEGSGTRSSLLWEVKRLLSECKELPQYLLMENVPQVIGKSNINYFKDWCQFLVNLGYKNYYKTLNAKDFGIPQNRERVFMVSILKSENRDYVFPNKIPLTIKLKDILDKSVDKKWYLNNTQIDKMMKWKSYQNPLDNVITNETKIIPTLTTRDEYLATTKLICEERYDEGLRFFADNLCGSLRTIDGGGDKRILEVNLPMICASRGRNPQNPKSRKSGQSTQQMIEINSDNVANTISTVQKDNYVLDTKFKIRKLTPKECFRLMGVKDKDYNKLTCSDSQKYKQSGNSIVVNVLMSIYENLFIKSTQSNKLF